MNTSKEKVFRNPPQSYWIDSISQPDYPTLEDDIHADIAIIGGGMAGICTAYLLSRHGINSVILEANRILKSTTGHTTAKITSQHGLIYSKIKNQISGEIASQYSQANETAIDMIKTIAAENNIECDFTYESAYVYTHSDEYVAQIEQEADTAGSLGIKAAFLEDIPLGFPIKAAVRFDNQARFHPRKFLLPLAEIIVKSGSSIFEQSRIVRIEENEKYTIISNNGKKVTAEKIIIASHYPCINKPGFYFGRIYADRSYVVAVKAKEKYPGGMYITAENPTRSLRNQNYNDGEIILVGGERHKTGQGVDTNEHYNALIDFAYEHFTVEDIPYRWSTQDCMTLDSLPFVGQFTAETPNIYVATGYNKWGMTNSIASAMILTDLITKGESPWLDAYSPSRSTVMASAKSFIVENANVAKELIKGKVSPISDDIEIANGDAQITEVNGQRAGAYRDENGQLHVVDTTCTHMGCELQWNAAERSWDCPCHGSRFSITGEVIEGPAVEPLEFQDINTIKKLMTEDF